MGRRTQHEAASVKPRRQCKKCPWRKGTNPRDIPNGYCEASHAALRGTIAEPGLLPSSRRLRLMACHESPVGEEKVCVGWLVHQLGPGNNLGLRLAVIEGRIDANVETVGKQHKTFEDTLPKRDAEKGKTATIHRRRRASTVGRGKDRS